MGVDVMQDILNYITNNGFAIVVAVYMIVVNNSEIKKNTESTNKLSQLIDRLLDTLEKK